MLRKFTLHQKLTRITGALLECLCTFMVISCWVLLRMRSFSDEICTENQNTHFMFNNVFWTPFCLRDNVEKLVEPDRLQVTVWLMHFAGWIPKATNSYLEYVIRVLIAFPLQNWLHERASMLRYTCSACLVILCLSDHQINKSTNEYICWYVMGLTCFGTLCYSLNELRGAQFFRS